MYKYAVYGNEEKTPLQVANEKGLNQDECIMCSEGKKQAQECTIINPKLIIIGPETEKIKILFTRGLIHYNYCCDFSECKEGCLCCWIEWALYRKIDRTFIIDKIMEYLFI